MTQLTHPTTPFDSIRREDDRGEFWSARELQGPLAYDQWRRFEDTIERAKAAAEHGGAAVEDHFADAGKLVDIGSGASRYVQDYRLTRYGAYLVAMNGDPRKPEVAAAQSYFAVRTREAEVREADEQRPMSEMEMARKYVAALEREQALQSQVEQLEPSARAWDHLADDAVGDMSVREAAQILDRDPAIRTGQRRLFGTLVDLGWLDSHKHPYQRHIDNGRLVRRLRHFTDQYTGDTRLADPQVRITAKGLSDLHKALGGSRPLAVQPKLQLVAGE